MILTEIYSQSKIVEQLGSLLEKGSDRIHIDGMTGSLPAIVAAALAEKYPDKSQLLIASGKEEAYYLLNDLETLLDEADIELEQKRALLFPPSYRKPLSRRPVDLSRSPHVDDDGGELIETDNANVMQRSEVVNQLNSGRPMLVVTFPEALSERVVSSRTLTRNTLRIVKGAKVDMDFVMDVLQEYEFERVDFVVEPGQYAVRGGIIDVFSYANDQPFRIEFFGDMVDSLRTFDPVTQLSVRQHDNISILPNM